ncbi:MAG: glutamyl-tRNA reductase [Granulosicoccaceae bacterium]
MSLLALGLNHHTAPVEIRERVAFAPERLSIDLQQLVQVQDVQEAAIVSTCNRTEIYCNLEGENFGELLRWLEQTHGIERSQLEPYLFSHSERDAVKHLLRVCSGLDSLVLGEPQILGQMKSAWQAAENEGTLGRHLNRLFQHAFTVAKKVRSDTAIGSSPVSVAFAAVQLSKQIFGDLSGKTALLLGAGETAELAMRHLHGQGVERLIVVNRTLANAEALAAEFGARAVPLTQLHDVMHLADVLIASTGSPLPVFGKGAVESAIKKRRREPMLMVDIAVPRDIEAEVGELDDVFLYTVDDLEHIVDEGRRSRQQAADEAEEIIEHQTEEFMGWLRSLQAVDTVRAVRDRAVEQQQELLRKAKARLAAGDEAEKVLEQLARALTNKLIDSPTRAMRTAASRDDTDTLNAARRLYGLDDETQ